MKRIMLMMAVGWMSVPVHAGFRAAPMARSSRAAGMPFAAELSLGLANGKAKEHVYDYDGPGGARRQLSRLDWDIKNVVMGGGSLSARLMDKLTVNAGLWLALSKGGGEMEDYDWLGPVYGVPAELNTHYSLSDVDVTAGYILDLNVAWDLVQRNGLVARVMAGYKQNGWTWEDRIRYMVYIDDYFIPDYSYAGDNGINYEQEFRIPYLGASADWMWNQFTFSGYLTWSPIVEATDWDEHVLRDTHYKETFTGGDMLGFGLEARYDFADGFFKGAFATASLDYQAVDLIVGDMEFYDASTGERGGGKNAAGIENEYLVISLGGGVRF